MIDEASNLVKEKVVCYNWVSGLIQKCGGIVQKKYVKKKWKINIKILILIIF